jgi:hypothetical protein
VSAAKPRIRVAIASRPEGAEVHRAHDQAILGLTPLFLDEPSGPGRVAFTLRLAGHQDLTLEGAGNRDSVLFGVLPSVVPLPHVSPRPVAPRKHPSSIGEEEVF